MAIELVEPGTSGSATVLVTSDLGPVAAASLVLLRDENSHEVGRTDERGVCLLPRDLLSGGSLTASAPGHLPCVIADAALQVQLEVAAVIQMNLQRLVPLQGRLLWKDRSPVLKAGLRVVAWKPGFLSEHAVLSAFQDGGDEATSLDRNAELCTATTEVDGSFEFPGGVVPGVYSLMAGGAGLVSLQHVVVDVTLEGRAELTMIAHYALAWMLVDEHGEPIPKGDAHSDRTGVFGLPATRQPDVDFRSFSDEEWAILGLESRRPLLASGAAIVGLVSDTPLEQAGPLIFDATFPGYEQRRVELMVPRAVDPLSLVTVELHANGDAVASLSVKVLGWKDPDGDTQLRQDPAYLELLDGNGRVVERCMLMRLSEDPIYVRGVRLGTYSGARLWLPNHLVALAPSSELPLIVDHEGRVTIDFDATVLRAADVVPIDVHGKAFTGRAQFVVASTERRLQGWYTFHAEPYRLDHLLPGDYTVTLVYALTGDGHRWQADPMQLTVTADTQAVLSIPMR